MLPSINQSRRTRKKGVIWPPTPKYVVGWLAGGLHMLWVMLHNRLYTGCCTALYAGWVIIVRRVRPIWSYRYRYWYRYGHTITDTDMVIPIPIWSYWYRYRYGHTDMVLPIYGKPRPILPSRIRSNWYRYRYVVQDSNQTDTDTNNRYKPNSYPYMYTDANEYETDTPSSYQTDTNTD